MSNKEENKLVWILEKAGSNLDVIDKTTKDYILGGIFAELGVLNNNQRIYEENEYLPHLTYLNKKITEGRLVGELDHPEGRFDLKLQNISHRIERIDYDPVTKTVKGRVRIFDTPSGKIAKTLIDAGYPLSISSRAAGEVDPRTKKVKIKKIFTFDLVADPGFESARLEIVNESLAAQGINFDVKSLLRDGVLNLSLINESLGLPIENSNIMVYDAESVSGQIKSLIESEEKEESQNNNNKNKKMEQYITEAELDKFMKDFSSRYDAKITSLSEQLTAALEENNALKTKIEESVVNTETETISKKLDATIDFIGTVLEKRIEGIVNYCDENDKVRGAMVNYLSEREKVTEGIINYLDENDKVRGAIVESIDESQKVLTGTVNYIKDFEKTINENFAIVEGISAYAERTMQEVDCIIEYNKAIKENINHNFGTIEKEVAKINEGLSFKTGTSLNEGASFANNPVGRAQRLSALNEGIEKILASVEKQKTEDFILGKKYHFFKHISEAKQEAFLALEETQKQKVLNALTESAYDNEAAVLKIWESALAIENKQENLWISRMPEKAKAFWSGLNESQKDLIIRKSSLINLNNDYQIGHFWNVQMQTMQPGQPLEKLNENFNPLSEIEGKQKLGYSTEVIKNVVNSLKKYN